MSRSYKKPHVWVSKPFPRWAKKAWRRFMKLKCRKIEVAFEPDLDFDEFHANEKEFGDWGTKCGWPVAPLPGDDTWCHKSFTEMQRK